MESPYLKLTGGSLQGNVAGEGAGIYLGGAPILGGSRFRLERSVLAGNWARGPGGGIWAGEGALLEVDHSTLVFNHSGSGAGVLASATANLHVFSNSILWANEPAGCRAEFTYCILDEKAMSGASTNLSTFPLFFDPTGTWEKKSALVNASLTSAGEPKLSEEDPGRWIGG